MPKSKNRHDLTAKNILRCNEGFASLFNSYFFHDANIINPESMSELDSSIPFSNTEIRQDIVRK